jgi:hypothetical protein
VLHPKEIYKEGRLGILARQDEMQMAGGYRFKGWVVLGYSREKPATRDTLDKKGGRTGKAVRARGNRKEDHVNQSIVGRCEA